MNRDCHYSPIERNRTLLHGKQNTAGKILIFWWDDESIYKHKEKQQLTSSSTFQQENRADEKRKDTPHSTSLFWGEWFDETMMNIYHFGYQFIILSTHQFIGFSSATSLRDKRMEGNATICRQVGRTSDLPAVRPADKERCIISMKRKGLPIRWYSHRLLRTEKP